MNLLFIFIINIYSAFATDQIVFISDSHGVGDFGASVRQWLDVRPDTEFIFFASGGSAPLQWTNGNFTTLAGLKVTHTSKKSKIESQSYSKMRTPKLSTLWAQMMTKSPKPRRISVIHLGTNFSHQASRKLGHIIESQELVEMALKSSDRCIWIGPPTMKRSPGFDEAGVQLKVDILLEATSLCEFIDSRTFTTYPEHGFDGIHYQWPLKTATLSDRLRAKELAQSWARSVTSEIEKALKK